MHAEFLRQGHFAIEADNIAALAYDMAAVELGGQPMADGTQVGGQFTKTELLSMARAFDVTLGRRPNMNEVERAATELKALVARQGRAPVNTDAFFGGFVAQQLVRQMPAHALVLAYTLPDRESVTTMAGTI